MRELTKREANLVSGAALIGITPFDSISIQVNVIKLGPRTDPVDGRIIVGVGMGYTGGALSSYGGDSFGTSGTGDLRGGS